MSDLLPQVTMYTDGGVEPTPNPGNPGAGGPGPGGYGVVLLHGSQRKELSGGYRLTTHNRMELQAAIAGLQALKTRCAVTLYTDSQYLAKAMNEGWARRWKSNGWMRNRREEALNPDLWAQLLELCDFHRVAFVWVKGHAGDADNEQCDQLSTAALRSADLPSDPGYENPPLARPSLFDG